MSPTFFRLNVGFHPILAFSGTAKKICAGTPRITRGMGTNITLEPGERVRKLSLKTSARDGQAFINPSLTVQGAFEIVTPVMKVRQIGLELDQLY